MSRNDTTTDAKLRAASRSQEDEGLPALERLRRSLRIGESCPDLQTLLTSVVDGCPEQCEELIELLCSADLVADAFPLAQE